MQVHKCRYESHGFAESEPSTPSLQHAVFYITKTEHPNETQRFSSTRQILGTYFAGKSAANPFPSLNGGFVACDMTPAFKSTCEHLDTRIAEIRYSVTALKRLFKISDVLCCQGRRDWLLLIASGT
jgi:hypothetical protein